MSFVSIRMAQHYGERVDQLACFQVVSKKRIACDSFGLSVIR
jgi:hypothetical protein